MKKKILIGIIIACIGTTILGCQGAARSYGGSLEVELPKDRKLVNVTWKEDSLWYLTRDMKEGEEAETYKFIEDSEFGLMEGEVTIKEIKSIE